MLLGVTVLVPFLVGHAGVRPWKRPHAQGSLGQVGRKVAEWSSGAARANGSNFNVSSWVCLKSSVNFVESVRSVRFLLLLMCSHGSGLLKPGPFGSLSKVWSQIQEMQNSGQI
jgi:hypothetical protein